MNLQNNIKNNYGNEINYKIIKQLSNKEHKRKVCKNPENNDAEIRNEIILHPNDKKVSRIVHISDIHISNDLSRDKEYYAVFNTFFEELIGKNISTDDLIVITGDTIDQADTLTPECIALTKYFFIGITNFCSIVLILGNHEQSIYDHNKLDSLTPIIMNNFLTKNPIHILLENKIYLYKNISFIVTQVGSKEVTEWAYKKEYINIHLYHGIIHGSTFENGFNARSNFALKDFGTFDYLLLGDVHQLQYLNKAKTAFYPSSLVQKSRSEHPLDHGYILLDLEKKQSQFYRIKNEYASYNLVMSKTGELNYDLDHIAKYANIKITINSSNKKHLEKLQNDIIQKGIKLTNFIETRNISNVGIDTTIKINKKKEILTNINNSDQLVNIIVDYIKENQRLDVAKYGDIQGKLYDIIKHIATSVDSLKNKNIIFQELEFSNILVFGKNNKINFKNGSYCVSEENSSGKSCLIDIISIALHSKSPRTNMRGDLIRHGQLEGSTKLTLYVNGILYSIMRNFRRKTLTSHPSETIIFEKDNEIVFDLTKNNKGNDTDNEEDNDEPDNKKTRTSDRKKIKEMIDNEIISYDDLFLCSVVSQTKKINFLLADNKRDLILKYSGLSIFSDISSFSAKKSGELTRQMTILYNDKCFNDYRSKIQKKSSNSSISFKDADMENMIKQIEENKKGHDEKITNNNKSFCDLENEFNMLNAKKIRLEERLKKYNGNNFDEMHDKDKLRKELSELEKTKTKIENDNEKFSEELAKFNTEIKNVKKSLALRKNIEKEKRKFDDNKKEEILNVNNKISKLSTKLKHTQIKKINDKDCKIELKKHVDEMAELHEKQKINEKEIEDIDKLINICNNDTHVLKNYKMYCLLEFDIGILNNKLELLEELKKYYEEEIKNVNTKKVKMRVSELNNKIKGHVDEIKAKENELKNIISYKDTYEKYKKINNVKELIKELKKRIVLKDSLIDQIDKKNKKILDLENYKFNIELDKEIVKKRAELSKIENKVFAKYDKYMALIDKRNTLEKKINDVILKLEKLKYSKNDIAIKIQEKEMIMEKIKQNDDICDKYKKDKKNLNITTKKYNIVRKKYLKNKKENEQNNIDDKQYYANYKIALSNYDKYVEIKNDKDSYCIINNLLLKNGLLDKILKEKVLVKLEQTANNILKSIGYEPISIKMIDKKGNKYKNNEIIITNSDGTVTNSVGYFERNIMELSIRMSLSQINGFVKINAIIIDEAFDGASKENYGKIIKLIDNFKDYYPFNLVVSHDQKFVKLFENRIKIIKPTNQDDIKKIGYSVEQL